MSTLFNGVFSATVTWQAPAETENNKRAFSRDHQITSSAALAISGSSAKIFHGNPECWNPEQLFLASIAQCHMLTFLFLAHRAGLKIQSYEDHVTGKIEMDADGIGGEFAKIQLAPKIVVECSNDKREATLETLLKLNEQTPRHCFIRRSVAVPVRAELSIAWI